MMDAVYDRHRSRTPVVAYVFLGLCLLVTLPSILYPSLYAILGGFVPRNYPWQVFTSIFEHGMPGIPAFVHLAFSAFLVLEIGVACERLLGRWRFLALTALAICANAALQYYVGLVNGASLVIWAWGPPLLVAVIHARRADAGTRWTQGYQRARGVLLLMYVGVTLGMTALPYWFGWRGNPLRALWYGNRFHAVATGVGIVLAGIWWGTIRRRLERMSFGLADGAARAGGKGVRNGRSGLRTDLENAVAGELALDPPSPDSDDTPIAGPEADTLEAGPFDGAGGGE